jgi:hypothetical protein
VYKYRVYGLVVESEVKFLQLMTADENEEPQVRIYSGNIKDEVDKQLETCPKNYDINTTRSCFRNKGGYYLIKDGKEIIFEPKEGYTPEKLGSWLLGFSFAMALLQRRTLAIHCSALSYDEGAILISGVPGAGKSSLTRVLLERGYKILADDVAAVEDREDGIFVHPTFPYQKLCRNEVEKRNLDMSELIYINEDKDKFLVPVKEHFDNNVRPLKYLIFVIIGNNEEIERRQLTGLNQLFALKENLFLHRLYGPWENAPEIMNMCLKVAAGCKVHMLVRPDGKDTLMQMADIIEDIVKNN